MVNLGLKPRAFVAFPTDTTTHWDPGASLKRELMLTWFFNDWLSGLSLTVCVHNAVIDAHGTGYNLQSNVIIYGATDLTINGR